MFHRHPFWDQGCIFRLTCSHRELTEDHVLTSAYVNIFRTVTRNAVNKSVWRKKDCFWLPLNKHTMNIFIQISNSPRTRARFSENQSAPRLENRKTSPCSPCAPNLLHVLVSRTLGYHNLCSPVLHLFVVLDYGAAKTRKVPTKITRSRRFQTLTQYPQNLSAKFSWRRVYANLVLPSWK